MTAVYSKALQLLSDRLLGLSTDAVGTGIVESLADLSRLTGASRAYVFLLNEDQTALDRAHEWCDQGVAGHDFSSFRGVPVSAFPWSMRQFLRGEVVYVRDSSALPTEAEAERGACEALGIGAYVNVPLFLGDRMVGWLGFDADAPNPGWEAREVELMRAAGRMLIFTIDRIQREDAFRAEQALSRRLASLGAFAAGLGHEVNNPLAYVSLNLELLRKRVEQLGDEKALMFVADCQEGIASISQTVEALRAFTRGKATDRVMLPVGHILDSALKLLAPQLALKARVEREGNFDACIEAAPSELGTVFANILQNAMDAIPNGRAADHHIRIHSERRDREVVIEVADSGDGFAEDALPYVFDPFFTTRAGSGGSGIGLALCYSIVTNLGGSIAAENPAGGGALIRVTLPIATPTAKPPRQQDVAPAFVKRRILIIDDVDLLRRVLRSLLDGHDVEEAADGNSAIAILRQDADWDLILCDLLMPNGTGQDVYRFVSEQLPSLTSRMVFTSGGMDDAASTEFLGRVPNRVLHKPITMETLLQVVQESSPQAR